MVVILSQHEAMRSLQKMIITNGYSKAYQCQWSLEKNSAYGDCIYDTPVVVEPGVTRIMNPQTYMKSLWQYTVLWPGASAIYDG